MQSKQKRYYHTAYLKTIGHVYGKSALNIVRLMTRHIDGWFVLEISGNFIMTYKL